MQGGKNANLKRFAHHLLRPSLSSSALADVRH